MTIHLFYSKLNVFSSFEKSKLALQRGKNKFFFSALCEGSLHPPTTRTLCRLNWIQLSFKNFTTKLPELFFFVNEAKSCWHPWRRPYSQRAVCQQVSAASSASDDGFPVPSLESAGKRACRPGCRYSSVTLGSFRWAWVHESDPFPSYLTVQLGPGWQVCPE